MGKGGYHPSEASLDLAEELAAQFGKEINRAETAELANALTGEIYADVVRVLGDTFEDIELIDASERRVTASAGQLRSGRSAVYLDQHMDFWLFNMCMLWTIASEVSLSGSEVDEFIDTFTMALDMEAGLIPHEEVRQRMMPYILAYPHVAEFAHCLSIASLVFVFCHELAHHQLDHMGQEGGRSLEFSADREGIRSLRK